MKRWLRRQSNHAGEWAVIDLDRDYRICAYHLRPGLGPHVHHPSDSDDRIPVEIEGEHEAGLIARAYAEGHSKFERRTFEEEVTRWKSGSKHG